MNNYSVLMSLYNKESPECLRAALDSILNQTINPDEIVLVEDGPLTKELYEILDEYKDCLYIVRNKKNLGLGESLRRGVKACRNEIIVRMDTDDIAVPNRCEKQLAFLLENPEVSVLGGQIEEFIGSPNNIIGKRVVPERDDDIKKYMKQRCPFNHMTVMLRKSVVLEAGNYQDWFWNEDYYLWVRLALIGAKFANLPDTLVYARGGVDLYQRRGGRAYYKSEIALQNYMLEKKVVNFHTYLFNCIKRLIVEIIIPPNIRGWVFKNFAREKIK